jgi:hypothetical protein
MNDSHALYWPEQFDFYHVGKLSLCDTYFDTRNASWLGYTVHGDGRGLLVIGFHPDYEPSMFAEIGNILCARIAMVRASAQDGVHWISPPTEVFPEQLEQWVKLSRSSKTYLLHFRGDEVHAAGETLPIRAYWFDSPTPKVEDLRSEEASMPARTLTSRAPELGA